MANWRYDFYGFLEVYFDTFFWIIFLQIKNISVILLRLWVIFTTFLWNWVFVTFQNIFGQRTKVITWLKIIRLRTIWNRIWLFHYILRLSWNLFMIRDAYRWYFLIFVQFQAIHSLYLTNFFLEVFLLELFFLLVFLLLLCLPLLEIELVFFLLFDHVMMFTLLYWLDLLEF